VSLSSKAREDALSSCGYEFDNEENILTESGELVVERGQELEWKCCLADALLGYGAKAVLHTITSSLPVEDDEDEVAEEMLETAYIQLLHLQCKPRELDEKLAMPANKLGATFEDFLDGDSLAPLRQKAADILCGKTVDLSPEESILLKMYGAAQGQTLGGKVESELAVAAVLVEEE